MNDTAMGIARRIVDHELAEASTADELASGIERVFQRLYGQLMSVIGPAGFQAVMRRSMYVARRGGALAIREVEWTDTSLALAVDASEAERARHDAVVLFEQLLALLERLIGESLTARILHREWPEIVPEPDGPGAETED